MKGFETVAFGEFPIGASFNDKFVVCYIRESETADIFITVLEKNKEPGNSYFVDFLQKGERLSKLFYSKTQDIIILGVEKLNCYFKLYYINPKTLEIISWIKYPDTGLLGIFENKNLIIAGYQNNVVIFYEKKDDYDRVFCFRNIDSFPLILQQKDDYVISWQNDGLLKTIVFDSVAKETLSFEIETEPFNYLIGDSDENTFYMGGSVSNETIIYQCDDSGIKKINLDSGEKFVSPELICFRTGVLVSLEIIETVESRQSRQSTKILNIVDGEIVFSEENLFCQTELVKGENGCLVLGVDLTAEIILCKFLENADLETLNSFTLI